MAVYTHITDADIAPALDRFDIGRLQSFEGLQDGIENTNYRLTTDRGRYILTLFEKRVNRDELPFYLAYMNHLSKKGLPCPAAAAMRDGQTVFTLRGKPAVITTFLDGAAPRDTTPRLCAETGRTLARMHLAAADFGLKRVNTMALPAWRGLIHACRTETEAQYPGLPDLLDAEMDAIAAQRPRSLPSGVVHADMFPDNVFFTGDALSGVIDFYFACTDAFAYDLMLTLNAWCFDAAGQLDVQKSISFLSAYQSLRPLSAAEMACLPVLGRAAALRIVATRLYDGFNPAAGALVTPKDPMEHLRILQYHRAVATAADYGIAP